MNVYYSALLICKWGWFWCLSFFWCYIKSVYLSLQACSNLKEQKCRGVGCCMSELNLNFCCVCGNWKHARANLVLLSHFFLTNDQLSNGFRLNAHILIVYQSQTTQYTLLCFSTLGPHNPRFGWVRSVWWSGKSHIGWGNGLWSPYIVPDNPRWASFWGWVKRKGHLHPDQNSPETLSVQTVT